MEQLVNFIIRPPRADYSPKNDLLEQEFMLKGRWFKRKDLEITNDQGYKLQCSHYMPLEIPDGKQLPCVIYCHGNSGCRADASEAAIILLPSSITLFTLDFSGSGLSDGEYVTLGWNEKNDLKAVVNFLRTDGNVSFIGLWGRSMGAVTSLMYGAEDPSIAGIVLDSPFSVLVDLMMELVDTYKYPLPKFTVKLAIHHLRKVIKKKANFDIMDLDTIQVAKCCFVPALIGHATDDDFIRPHHSDHIYEAYAGDKNVIKFDGDHNSPRPQFYFDSITIFFHNVLNPPESTIDAHGPRAMQDTFNEGDWNTMHELVYGMYTSAAPSSEFASSSTEDAILKLRSRRPMSRTEAPPVISTQVQQHTAEENGSDCDHGPSSDPCLPNDHQESCSNAINNNFVHLLVGDFRDIPCSLEEEERMLMEAIIQSLTEMEVADAQKDNGVSLEAGGAPTNETGAANVASDAVNIRTMEHDVPLEEAEAVASMASSMPTGAADGELSDASGQVTSAPPSSGEMTLESSKDLSGGLSSTIQEGDMASGTRATLVVQKSPTTGSRWGQFFRSR